MIICRSRRSRQRLKTEVLPQCLYQLLILRRRPLQAEPGVIVLRGCVFVAPQAARPQVDDLLASVDGGNFQAQIEIRADHHGQLADEHQPVLGHVTQETDGLVGDAVEHFEKIRQLMPLDPAVGEHAEFTTQGP